MGDPYFEGFIELVARLRQSERDYHAYGNECTRKLIIQLKKEVDAFIENHNMHGAPGDEY